MAKYNENAKTPTVEEFDKIYNALSNGLQKIVLKTLIRLEPICNHPRNMNESSTKNKQRKTVSINKDIYAFIKLKMKEQGLTLEKMCDKIEDKRNSATIDTLKTIMKRKPLYGEYYEDLIEILDISEDIKNIQLTKTYQCDIFELYDTIPDKSKQAIYFLTNALYMYKLDPEIFEDTDEDLLSDEMY